MIRRTTHNLTTAPISFNQKQAFSSSSTPPVPGIFSQSQSFISTRSFNSNQQSNPNLLPIPSHHQLTSHSNRQQEESAQDHLYTEKEDQDRLAFMSNINEKRSGRSKIVSSQSGLFKMDQIIDDKEDNCSKPNLFIQKYAEMKQVNTSFHESICHQPTLPPTTISSSLPEKNRLDHRERVTTYPTRNYTESETRIKRENDIFEEDDATQDMIFDIQFS